MSQVLRQRAIGMLSAGTSTKAVARELNAQTISHLQRRLREFGSIFNRPNHFREELTDLCASLIYTRYNSGNHDLDEQKPGINNLFNYSFIVKVTNSF